MSLFDMLHRRYFYCLPAKVQIIADTCVPFSQLCEIYGLNSLTLQLLFKVSNLYRKGIRMVNRNVNYKNTELLNSLKNKENVKILFVCLGNICRSPAAEAVMKKLVEEAGLSDLIFIDSAGIIGYHEGEQADPRMRSHAARRGYRLDSISRPVRTQDFFDFDLIIGMDNRNVDDLKQKAPDLESVAKIHQMTEYSRNRLYDYVPDPYYSGAEGFELVLDLLEDACAGLLEAVRRSLSFSNPDS